MICCSPRFFFLLLIFALLASSNDLWLSFGAERIPLSILQVLCLPFAFLLATLIVSDKGCPLCRDNWSIQLQRLLLVHDSLNVLQIRPKRARRFRDCGVREVVLVLPRLWRRSEDDTGEFSAAKNHVPYWRVNNPTLSEFCFWMIGRADIEGSKSHVAMNAWRPQASYPCGNFSDTSFFKLQNKEDR